MKKHLKKALVLSICATLISGVAASAAAREATKPNPSTPNSAQELIAVASGTNETFNIGDAQSGQGASTSRLLGYFDWLQCRSFGNETWVISSFNTSYLGAKKSMAIQCGSATTQGYLHIADGQSNHQLGWRNRINQANPGDNTDTWDDFMWWSAQQAWNVPLVSIDQGNNKLCRSAPIKMYARNANGTLSLRYTFNPSFIWSMSMNRLITAIPSTTATC